MLLGIVLSIIAGMAMSVQGVMNTRLGEGIGNMEANAFVQGTAFALAMIALLFWRQGSFSALGSVSRLYWLGGALGLVITLTVMARHKKPRHDGRDINNTHVAASCCRADRCLRSDGKRENSLRLEQICRPCSDVRRYAAVQAALRSLTQLP